MNSQQIKDSFGLMAKNYKKYRPQPHRKLYAHISSLLKNQGKSKNFAILDIGCGVGNSTEPLLKIKNVSAIGCDVDERMLKEARSSAKNKKLPIKYVHAAAEKLPFANEAFDMAISGAAFHWFATVKTLTEIKRVLKNNGIYLVFWVMETDANPAVGIEVYKKYKWSGIPHKLREIDYVKNLFVKAKLKNVKTTKIPITEKSTISDTLGLIKTNSMYALLSLEQRKDFDKSIQAAYKEFYKNKNIIVSKNEICICWGTK